MLRMSNKLLLAIEAVVDIAYNAGGEPVQSREIARRQGIPQRYLEQVLQRLVRAGVLAGVRGPRGGYRLARERRRISVGEITRAVDALASTSNPTADSTGSDLAHKVLKPMWSELQKDLMDRLDAISIEDLCVRARSAEVASKAFHKLDYSI